MVSLSTGTWARASDLETVIEDPAHIVARRIGDVLRAGSRARTTILIDDEENILQAWRAGVQLDGIYLTGEGTIPSGELASLARPAGVPIRRLTNAVAKALFGRDKRVRIFALARHPPRHTLDDLARARGDVVILDGVRLAGNIGALTRTSAALGGAGLVLVDSGLDTVYDRRLIRSSRGLVFAHPVVIASRGQVRRFLHEAAVTLVGLTADATVPLRELTTEHGRVAILLGSERTGASGELNARAVHRYAVPMHHRVESLNVSVAGALALYERSAATRAERRDASLRS